MFEIDVDFTPDGDEENGLYSMLASAEVVLKGQYDESEVLKVDELQLSGYVFIPSTVNGDSIEDHAKLVNEKHISWVAAAILSYMDNNPQLKNQEEVKLSLDGGMEC
jgi:hypothetical protein